MWVVGVAAYVLSVTNRTSLSAVGVDAAHLFQADASTLSLFAVLQLAVYGLMQVPVGVLLDRFGSRPIMVTGMILMSVGQLVMAFAPNVGVAIVARMILGAGDAAIFPGVLRLVSIWFPAQRGPLMAQLTGIVGQLGQLVALLPLPLLLHSTSWSVAFGSLAGLGVLFTMLVFAVIRNRPSAHTADISVNTDTGAIRVVTSQIDLRVSLRAALTQPGTRLGFWTHFTTPFAGTAFMMLWGIPFLTIGEGLSTTAASLVTTVFVVCGIVFGPVIGTLSSRHPTSRSLIVVLPTVALQVAAWLAVILWPGPAPLWLLILLVIALASGGPASMVAFDHARTHNPQHRLSTATGVVNGGGFLAGLIAIFLIGLALDLQGAGAPDTYRLDAFRWAFLTQIPLWLLGSAFIVRERRLTRRVLGLDQSRKG